MKPKLKIVHVVWKFDRSGAERVAFDLLCALRDRGAEVALIACVPGGNMAEEAKAANLHYTEARAQSRFELARWMRKEFKARQPDIWHTHLGADLWAGLMLSRSSRAHWVSTLHNLDRGLSPAYNVARAMAYARVRHLVCVSKAVSDYAGNLYRVPEKKRSVIPNGIDLKRVIERASGVPSDLPKLITVGRLSPQKDQATLLRALAHIRRPWQLDIVGTGSERLALERLAETLGIRPRIRFLGSVNNVPQLLAESDLFLFPSRWEGQGLVLLEAVAAGLPFIASDLPVFREMFDETAAIYAPAGEVEAWQRAIESFLSDSAPALVRAQTARRIVREHYALDHMADSYLALYHKLLSTQVKR